MKQKDVSPQEAMKQIQKIFKERGTKALEMARKEILKEKIESDQAREALSYFITKYWKDLARPSLMSLICEAVGGSPELTTPVAAPLIMISGAIDIHDDIIDQSNIKEGRPTVLGKFGKDIALLVGDALLFKGFTVLHEILEKSVPSEKRKAIRDVVKGMFFELGDAEALELQFRGSLDVSPEEYLQVVRKKAADVEAYARISAILGDASRKEVESLVEYGRVLGMLAILNDDILDMTDHRELTHRIQYECLPLPMLYVLQNPKLKYSISSLRNKRKITRRDAEKIMSMVDKAGGFRQLNALIRKLVKNGSSTLTFIKTNRTELMLLIRSMLPEVT